MNWIDDPRCNQGSRNKSNTNAIVYKKSGDVKSIKGTSITHEDPYIYEWYLGHKGIINQEDVKVIREWWFDGCTCAEIAEVCEVSISTIYKIIRRIKPYHS